MRQLDRANTILNEATATRAKEDRRAKLEEAFKAYVEILPLLSDTDLRMVRRAVLQKIHVIEQWIEREIEESVTTATIASIGNNNSSNSSKR